MISLSNEYESELISFLNLSSNFISAFDSSFKFNLLEVITFNEERETSAFPGCFLYVKTSSEPE